MTILTSHLMFAAVSAWHGAQAFKQLGFKVTPLRKNAVMGDCDTTPAGSSLVLFRSDHQIPGNYIEISNLGDSSPAPFMLEILSSPPAAKMICCYTDDMDAVLKNWRQHGVEFSYNIEANSNDNGEMGANSFKISIPKINYLPITIDVVEFSSVDIYKNEIFYDHPNAVQFLRDIYCIIPRGAVQKTALLYSNLLQSKTRQVEGVGLHICVNSGDMVLHFLDNEAMYSLCGFDSFASIACLGLVSEDLNRTKQTLIANEVNFKETETQIIVGPTPQWKTTFMFTQS